MWEEGKLRSDKQNFSENLGNFDNLWGPAYFPLSRTERGKLFLILFHTWTPKPILSLTFKIIKADGGRDEG